MIRAEAKKLIKDLGLNEIPGIYIDCWPLLLAKLDEAGLEIRRKTVHNCTVIGEISKGIQISSARENKIEDNVILDIDTAQQETGNE